MSLKSYFRKDHKYKSQADLKDMTAEEIVSLNPSDIGFYTETETGGIPLTGVKKRALYNLLARKKIEKKTGINIKAREKIINEFLKREGLINNAHVTKLLMDTDYKATSDRLQMKTMENRLIKLKDQPQIPYTDEEEMYLRLEKLHSGGKSIRKKVQRKRQTYRRK